jgi:hypothetical protein
MSYAGLGRDGYGAGGVDTELIDIGTDNLVSATAF